MKIVATEGCTCYGITIDNKDLTLPEHTTEEVYKEHVKKIKGIIIKVLDTIKESLNNNALIDILDEIVEQMASYQESTNSYHIGKYVIYYDDEYFPKTIECDGESVSEVTLDIVKDILQGCIRQHLSRSPSAEYTYNSLKALLFNLAYNYGDPEYKYHCDQCGDNVYDFTLNIK